MEAKFLSIPQIRAPIRGSRHGRPIRHPLPLVLPLVLLLFSVMAGVDLNDSINWDELDDFDGEARELGGDFFFELEDEGYSMNSNFGGDSVQF